METSHQNRRIRGLRRLHSWAPTRSSCCRKVYYTPLLPGESSTNPRGALPASPTPLAFDPPADYEVFTLMRICLDFSSRKEGDFLTGILSLPGVEGVSAIGSGPLSWAMPVERCVGSGAGPSRDRGGDRTRMVPGLPVAATLSLREGNSAGGPDIFAKPSAGVENRLSVGSGEFPGAMPETLCDDIRGRGGPCGGGSFGDPAPGGTDSGIFTLIFSGGAALPIILSLTAPLAGDL